jgi:hypothetical protein
MLTNRDGKQFPGQAKTTATLDYPVAAQGPGGVTHVTQRVGLATVLPNNPSKELRAKEMQRPAAFEHWIEKQVPYFTYKAQATSYSTPDKAAAAVNRAVRPKFNRFRDDMIIQFDFR